jgi:hypothetical protein
MDNSTNYVMITTISKDMVLVAASYQFQSSVIPM